MKYPMGRMPSQQWHAVGCRRGKATAIETNPGKCHSAGIAIDCCSAKALGVRRDHGIGCRASLSSCWQIAFCWKIRKFKTFHFNAKNGTPHNEPSFERPANAWGSTCAMAFLLRSNRTKWGTCAKEWLSRWVIRFCSSRLENTKIFVLLYISHSSTVWAGSRSGTARNCRSWQSTTICSGPDSVQEQPGGQWPTSRHARRPPLARFSRPEHFSC